jgi:hypothetical protein
VPSPASAEFANALTVHTFERFMSTLNALFADWGDEGHIPWTEIPAKREEQAQLTAAVPELLVIAANPESGHWERLDALEKLHRKAKLDKELGDVQNQGTPQETST